MKTMQHPREGRKHRTNPPRVILPPSPNLISSLVRVARKYGDVVQVLSPVFNFYFICDPDLVHKVLVTKHMCFVKGDILQRGKKVFGESLLTSEGAFHHRQKRLVQPAFYSSKVASYADAMIDHADRMLDSWKTGQALDIHKEMTHLTMAIIARCLFNEDIDTASPGLVGSLSDVIEYFNRLSGPFAWFFEKIPVNRRYEASLARIDKMIYEKIRDRRRRRNEDLGDILSMLLRARDQAGRPAMSDKQIRDEALILFAAGHETTANALSWTWYLISRNPKVEKKLHEEIDLVLGKELGRKPSAEDIPKLDYTRRVFTEALRLYPPAWVITRKATRNVRIGEYEIPRGANVLMSQYVMQHDPRYFPQPERFDPDRWTEGEMRLPETAYFPFGGGPRNCVGEQFAWMEGVLIIARTASRWKLELLPREDIQMLPRTTLRPKKGIRMRVFRRD